MIIVSKREIMSSVAQYILYFVKYYNIITDEDNKKLMFIIHQFFKILYFCIISIGFNYA